MDNLSKYKLMQRIGFLQESIDNEFKEDIINFIKELIRIDDSLETGLYLLTDGTNQSLLWTEWDLNCNAIIDPIGNQLSILLFGNGQESSYKEIPWKEDGSYQNSLNTLLSSVRRCISFIPS